MIVYQAIMLNRQIYVKVLKLNNPIHCEDLLNHPSNYLNHPSYGLLLRNDLHKMYDDLRMSLYYKVSVIGFRSRFSRLVKPYRG